MRFKLFLNKVFTHREKEDSTPERTKILKMMTPGEAENLKEGMSYKRVHKNIHPEALINLAKNNPENQSARFVIGSDNKINGGASNYFVHGNLLNPEDKHLEHTPDTHIRGYVTYDKSTNKAYYSAHKNFIHTPADHPQLKRLEKAGIQRGILPEWDRKVRAPRPGENTMVKPSDERYDESIKHKKGKTLKNLIKEGIGIASAMQNGSFIYAYAMNGSLLFVIPAEQGLIGFTPSAVSIKDGHFIHIYNEKGTRINTIPA